MILFFINFQSINFFFHCLINGCAFYEWTDSLQISIVLSLSAFLSQKYFVFRACDDNSRKILDLCDFHFNDVIDCFTLINFWVTLTVIHFQLRFTFRSRSLAFIDEKLFFFLFREFLFLGGSRFSVSMQKSCFIRSVTFEGRRAKPYCCEKPIQH